MTDALFRELDDLIQQQEYEKAKSTCARILEQEKDDPEATACLLLCNIFGGSFTEALDLINSNAALADSRKFEKAYCLYRTNDLDGALRVLESIEHGVREKELSAQVHYKVGNYSECIGIYKEVLLAQEDEDNRMELFVNLAAALAAAKMSDAAVENFERNKSALESSYEYLFNIACACVFNRDYDRAEKLLKQAEKVCTTSMQEEGYDEDAIRNEVAVIRVQLAFVLQLTGDTDSMAQGLLDDVLKAPLDDKVVAAVGENNRVSLRRDHKLFNAEKKLQSCCAASIQSKLLPEQRETINFNRALVLLKMGKVPQCQELVEELAREYPDSHMPAVILASLLLKDGKREEALALLHENADRMSDKPENQAAVLFIIAQIHMHNGNIGSCIDALQALPETERHRPPVVATLVRLFEKRREYDRLETLLDDAVRYWTERSNVSPQTARPILQNLLRGSGEVLLKHNRGTAASRHFIALSKLDKMTKSDNLPPLVLALAYADPTLASKYAADLPPIDESGTIDPDALENLAPPRRRARAEPVTEAQDDEEKSPDAAPEVAPAKPKPKKKKRKNKLPKDLDAPVNPERWLPRHMRSDYKPSKKAKESRGAQGGVTKAEEESAREAAREQKSQPKAPGGGGKRGGNRRKKKK